MEPELELDLALAEEMALSKADKDWITEQHKAAHQATGWRRVALWLKEWGVLAAIVTGSIAIVAIALTSIVFAVSEVRNNSEFRGQTKARLDSIEASLRTLRASQSPQKVLHEIASMNLADFAMNLPALRRVTEQPTSAVFLQPDTVREVSSRLQSTNEATPDYWGTTLAFIRWASAGISPSAPPPGGPSISLTRMTIDMPLASFMGPMNGRTVTLDGAKIRDGTFENCRIIFRGDPTALTRIKFINRVFDFPVVDQPPPPLKRISQQLLAQNIQRVLIESL